MATMGLEDLVGGQEGRFDYCGVPGEWYAASDRGPIEAELERVLHERNQYIAQLQDENDQLREANDAYVRGEGLQEMKAKNAALLQAYEYNRDQVKTLTDQNLIMYSNLQGTYVRIQQLEADAARRPAALDFWGSTEPMDDKNKLENIAWWASTAATNLA